jgi:hypothetical protein
MRGVYENRFVAKFVPTRFHQQGRIKHQDTLSLLFQGGRLPTQQFSNARVRKLFQEPTVRCGRRAKYMFPNGRPGNPAISRYHIVSPPVTQRLLDIGYLEGFVSGTIGVEPARTQFYHLSRHQTLSASNPTNKTNNPHWGLTHLLIGPGTGQTLRPLRFQFCGDRHIGRLTRR